MSNKTIKLTTSIPLIRYVYEQDGLYNQVVDDNHQPYSEFTPYIGPGMYWFIFFEGVIPAGFARLEKINEIMYMCHIAILEKYREGGNEEWGKQVVEYAKKLGIKKLLAMSPVPAAVEYAKKCGATEVATIKKSFKKHGQLLDQILLEMDL